MRFGGGAEMDHVLTSSMSCAAQDGLFVIFNLCVYVFYVVCALWYYLVVKRNSASTHDTKPVWRSCKCYVIAWKHE